MKIVRDLLMSRISWDTIEKRQAFNEIHVFL